MRNIHRPPVLRADNHDSMAVNMLPKCILPVGEGANLPTGIMSADIYVYMGIGGVSRFFALHV